MSNQTVNKRHCCESLLGSALSFVAHRSAVFCILLVALVLSGTVPQGFMRSAADDGMMLVLCTPNGPTEVWMTADGDIQEKAPIDHTTSEQMDCLAVTLSLVLVQSWLETLVNPAEFSPFRTTFIDQRRALVVEHSPLQPRAPPKFI
ncbi:DUF2946 family protein [Pacificibacter marinus]|uniref:DUF2946 family protein n=1 Tax=Pacificibacter marinus TaxID=658057 RepID=UPI001C079889|nr:DUF2946 family protein [Pacificibacter marinus]MBU2867849.1 hypothetical protein [Pacificibacter marinus]